MKYKKACAVLFLNVLPAIVVFNMGYTAENTFEINMDKKPGKIDTDTAINYLDKYEQVYLDEILRPFKEDANRKDRNGKDSAEIKPYDDKRLDILLRLEDVKGQIIGPLYSGQMQGLRKLLYVLILTDDGVMEHVPFDEMRYEMVMVTSDNILKLSKIRSGINEKIYITDDTKNMLKDIVSEIITVNFGYTKRQFR